MTQTDTLHRRGENFDFYIQSTQFFTRKAVCLAVAESWFAGLAEEDQREALREYSDEALAAEVLSACFVTEEWLDQNELSGEDLIDGFATFRSKIMGS